MLQSVLFCNILTFPFSRKLQGIFELVYSMLGCPASFCKVFTQSYNAFKEMHAMISHKKLTTLGGARAVQAMFTHNTRQPFVTVGKAFIELSFTYIEHCTGAVGWEGLVNKPQSSLLNIYFCLSRFPVLAPTYSLPLRSEYSETSKWNDKICPI